MEPNSSKTLGINTEEQGFNTLKGTILKSIGLNCDYYRDSYLRRRINIRMKNRGVTSYWEYARFLKAHPDEYSLLINDLTINYTKFFRDPDVFLYFQNEILPKILASKKTIRMLSAGCSSGEEPYTVSMVINEALEQRASEHLISIYSVDLDDNCLKKAEIGEYERQELEGISAIYLGKYFTQNGSRYRLKEDVKRFVRFRHMDLTQELQIQNLDIVFCRNVFIYFNKSAQTQIFKNFHKSLLKDGYLIIGKSEMLPDEVRSKFRCLDVTCKVFQKNEDIHAPNEHVATCDLNQVVSR